ncbi:MAG: hypothetical protein JSV80_09345 [Acidobacteriota bacterium]|nr:MAG: hypothetical protein JSV80_09345 [Acidobacteriota bacterium]
MPRMLRCVGYRSRRDRRRWVGYCLELHLRAEARDWDELLERLIMGASMRLAHLAADPDQPLPGKAPLRLRALYAYTALLHFLRPNPHRRLADVSSGLLVPSQPGS